MVVKAPNDCWLWIGQTDKDGYGRVPHSLQREFGTVLAHRISKQLKDRVIIHPNVLILHNCNNPPCCNPKHLKYGTNQINVEDRMQSGRSALGERIGNSKLTEVQVRHLREMYKQNKRLDWNSLSYELNVRPGTAFYAAKGISWKHI